MGAGSGIAGADPAGYDALASTPRPGVDQTDAVEYLIQLKGARRLDSGILATTHWVDQAVNLALGINQGDVASNPKLGNRVKKIPRGSGAALEAAVTDAIHEALGDLLDRGDILVSSLTIDTSTRGRILVFVNYINLRLVVDEETRAMLVRTVQAQFAVS